MLFRGIEKKKIMRKSQAKKLRKAANAIAKLSKTDPHQEYKKLKSIHKNLAQNEKNKA